jgi:hypothetical protein
VQSQFPAIIAALWVTDESLQLDLLCRGVAAHFPQTAVLPSAQAAVVALMGVAIDNATIQERCAGAIANILQKCSREQQTLWGEAGACQAVIAAMTAHAGSAAVQECCARAVTELSRWHCVNGDRLAAAGAFTAIAAAMRNHIGSAPIQRQCALALEASAWWYNTTMVSAAGVGGALMAAMRSHAASAAVQADCARAVISLACADGEARWLYAVGKCGLLLTAMRAHATSQDVQDRCAMALSFICSGMSCGAPVRERVCLS